MAKFKNGWIPVDDSNVHYRKAEGRLEMTCLSAAIPPVIAFLLVSGLIEFVIAISSINNPNLRIIAILFLILFMIAPGLSFPWLPCRDHMIVDNGSGKLEILKKNINHRVIFTNTFNICDIQDIIIRLDSGYKNSTQYVLLLKIEHKGKVKLYSSFFLSSVRSVEGLLRFHLKNTVTSKTYIQFPDMTIPIYTGEVDTGAQQSATHPPSHEPVLVCAIDHSPIEGVVYACPSCHALLCNACMKVHVARSLGCPGCGKPVLASGMMNETKLLAIVDDKEGEREDG